MTNEEVKQIIIDNQMTYNDFVSYFNVSFDDAVRIFQHLDLKKCSKGDNCVNSDGAVQSRENFYNNKNMRDGLDSRCIYCKKQIHHNNKEHRNQKACQYRQNNKEYFNQKGRQYRQNNKEHCKQRKRQYRQNNKEYFNQKTRQFYQNNKEYCKQKSKEYTNSYARFDTFDEKINYADKTRKDPNNLELLQVKCAYCGSWFNPTNQQVQSRINALEGRTNSLGVENRPYCSDECKQSCPIYHQILYSKDDPNRSHIGTPREVQSELRQLVFERDNWTCQRCNTHKNNLPVNISLHCHHIEGIRHEPLESADADMCMTVCSECHKEIHQIPGCTYQDMQCHNN